MAHWAEINADKEVVRVLVVGDDVEDGQKFLAEDLKLGGMWLRTSYNTVGGEHRLGGTPFRKNYAGIGFTYDSGRDAFIPPKPFASWTLDEDTCLWSAPVPYPTDGVMYSWNEDKKDWEAIVNG